MPTVQPDRHLVEQIRAELEQAAEPERAPKMQAYMKSEMAYLGVPVPAVRAIARAAERERRPSTTEQLIATSTALWRQARYREHRYAATELTNAAAARKLRTMATLPMFEEMIVTGAWWDHVDEVSHRIGHLLLQYPDEMTPTLRRWASADDRWLRRTSVICQLQAKTATDLALLSDAIEANLADPDFFLRKAIGWALREYAKTDPSWVRTFVAAHDSALSGLSRREALKHL
jgi:3-methyladenine DNA glycosylase AlkD